HLETIEQPSSTARLTSPVRNMHGNASSGGNVMRPKDGMGTSAIQFRSTELESIRVGGVVVTPRARALVVRLPFGEFVWNQPTSVRVEQNGQTETMRIVDATLIAQTAVIASMLALGIVVATRRL